MHGRGKGKGTRPITPGAPEPREQHLRLKHPSLEHLRLGTRDDDTRSHFGPTSYRIVKHILVVLGSVCQDGQQLGHEHYEKDAEENIWQQKADSPH